MSGDTVSVSGRVLITGTHGVIATATTTLYGESVSSLARVDYRIANQLPLWVSPASSAVAIAYTGETKIVGLYASAPEQLSYRLSPNEVVAAAESISVNGDKLSVTLQLDGARNIVLDAVVDDETIRSTQVKTHAFRKAELRALSDIASLSEAALASNPVPLLEHATAYPAGGPVYNDGVHILYAVDTLGGSVRVACNGVSIATHAARAGADGSKITLMGSAVADPLTPFFRSIVVITILPDGATRIRTGSVDVTGSAATSGFGVDSASVTFEISGSAQVGNVYAAPAFDATPIVGASYELTSPYFVPLSPPAYVHSNDLFEVNGVLQDPDPRLRFEIIKNVGVTLASVSAEEAVVTGTVPVDGPAYVTLRARRINGTWIDGVVNIEGLTIVWPELDLGQATVGTRKTFNLIVTSSYAVALTIPTPSPQNAVSVVSSLGSAGSVEIVPDVVGPASATVVATCKGVSRYRVVTILVRHTVPVWTEGTIVNVTVFAKSAFDRTTTATCSGVTTYSLISVSPDRPDDETELNVDSGKVRARVQADTTLTLRASAPDGIVNAEDMQMRIDAYNPGEVFGASSDNADGPAIVMLMNAIESKLRFGVFANQIGYGEPMRFYPKTDAVALRNGGVLVYSIEFDEGASDTYAALRIPGVADVAHSVSAAGTQIRAQVHPPSNSQPEPPAGKPADGAAEPLAEGLITTKPDTVAATMVVQWDRDGSVRVGRAPGGPTWEVVAVGNGTLPVEVDAQRISFDVASASSASVGGHMLATFPNSSRVAEWRASSP